MRTLRTRLLLLAVGTFFVAAGCSSPNSEEIGAGLDAASPFGADGTTSVEPSDARPTESDAQRLDAQALTTDAGLPDAQTLEPDAQAFPTADGGPEVSHPFGSHGGYFAHGVLFPGVSQAERDAAAAAFYDSWKQRYLKPGCAPGERRVKSSPSTDAYTVSEAHGYGMIFVVMMAGHDPQAQELFDGLLSYYEAHPSGLTPALMSWAQNASCADVDGNDAATDGDLDIAYSLLLADRQWGSDGGTDYLAKARRIIAAILAAEIHPSNSLLVGDWVDASDSHYDGTRTSDFMPDHFRAFARGSGEARWSQVVEKTWAIAGALQDQHAATTGLFPDFAIDADTDQPRPAPAGWLEGDDDGHYSWNACRTPWRLTTDYLMNGEPRAQTAARRLTAWIRSKTGDDPRRIRDGYDLAGAPLGNGNEMAFVAPFGVTAMVEAQAGGNQPWLDALWSEIAGRAPEDYFADSIKLMALLVMSGNWWTP